VRVKDIFQLKQKLAAFKNVHYKEIEVTIKSDNTDKEGKLIS
jgi:hypothetical protein